MVRIGSIVMNVADNRRAAAFWSSALGYVASPHNPAFLIPDRSIPDHSIPDHGIPGRGIPGRGEGPPLHLDEDDRMHLDLWADNEDEQRAEVERLVSLGATRVDWSYPDDADFIVLADTEGNLFCVINAAA